ncbi:type II secretion system protein [Candidatus Saccharibacteria bacterium]|nr:type II secretion system protein [Candidatus Saccharibacteria bacterium]
MSIKRGDTMIEVMFAIAVFALVSVLSLIVMNSGVSTAEATLELSMARNEIDAQAEGIRYIHNSFLSEREFPTANQTYLNLWRNLKSYINAYDSNAVQELSVRTCEQRYTSPSNTESIFHRKAFVVNTRNIDPNNPSNTLIGADQSRFKMTSLYPRIIFGGSNDSDTSLTETYTNFKTAEGIWVIPIESQSRATSYSSALSDQPEFFDFHIYTCWYAPGRDLPTTIGTIIRLYNPEMLEVTR